MKKSKRRIKIEHFQNLLAVAYADGKLDINEAKLLAEKAEEYNISQKFVNELIDNVNNLELIIPLNNEERTKQLIDSVYMAMVDGEIHLREYNLCLKIAERLGFDKKYLDEIIESIKKLWKSEIKINTN